MRKPSVGAGGTSRAIIFFSIVTLGLICFPQMLFALDLSDAGLKAEVSCPTGALPKSDYSYYQGLENWTYRKEGSERQGDWKGIGKDATYFLGYQVVFAGFLYVLPESITHWSNEQKHCTVNQWIKNVQEPHWDNDALWINYLGHPYWGATFYIRARERGFSEFGSFWWSAAFSAMYEFGIEAFFEKPSYNDLIVTPAGGVLVGKFIFEPIRDRIKAKNERAWFDHLVLVLTDPLGAANGVVERTLGVKPNIRLIGAPTTQLRPAQSPHRTAGSQKGQDESRRRGVGIAINLAW